MADSACSATAYLCGVKANFQTIGVTAQVKLNDCHAANQRENQVESLIALAQKMGKSTGLVTSTRITHASPAGAYAHIAQRNFESDADVMAAGQNPNDCEDIARQMMQNDVGRKINVIMGGGRAKFLPAHEMGGERLDGANLIKTWIEQNDQNTSSYIFDKNGLLTLDFNKTKNVLGLFHLNHMNYNLDANHDVEPTLSEMTEASIKLLSKNENGFFLFVEGGRIDQAHHETKAKKALDETIQVGILI